MSRHPLAHGKGEKVWSSAHADIKTDDTLWSSLAVVGIQGDGLGGLFERRQCPACGSTLARRITALDAVRVLATMGQIHAQSLDTIVAAAEASQRLPPKQPSPSDS
jgi:hypothetical protein